jgi:NAD(P)-dependent dehydrogenase (short-subunit alcohol dehydrogenase family)
VCASRQSSADPFGIPVATIHSFDGEDRQPMAHKGDLDGRAILITGGSRGIGLATARRFLDAGASVAIVGRDRARLEAARQELGGTDQVTAIMADVTTAAECRRAVAEARASLGRLDVLFTNAGNYEAAPLEEVTEDLWNRTIATHLTGTFFCIQAAVPSLRETGGSVVTMASDAGLLGFAGGWSAYCAAKGGVVNLTRQLAIDLAPDVRVNAVAPGPVGTAHLYADLAASTYGGFEDAGDAVQAVVDTLPLRRMIEPEEIADAVVFLAGARSMTGAVLSIDAGTTIALP